jgi:hypothetical protein
MLTASDGNKNPYYHISDIEKEVAFRKLMEEWVEVPVRDDGGCGHDQNDDYYDE